MTTAAPAAARTAAAPPTGEPATGAHRDAGRRGRTVIADRVVTKIAAQACVEVDHVHPTTPALAGRVLHQQPAVSADADVDGHLVQLRVQVAVDYPVSLVAVTGALRDHVRNRMAQLCELTVTDMDIRGCRAPIEPCTGKESAVSMTVKPHPSGGVDGTMAPALPRVQRSVPAVIVAVLLLAASGLVIAQAISIFRTGSLLWWDAPSVADRLHSTQWQDPTVIAAAGVLIVIGLWLLLLAVLPARHTLIELRESDPAVSTGISESGLRRGLSAAALRVDGVSTTDTRIHRGTATVMARSPLRRSESLPAAVTNAVTDRVAQLDPATPLTVRATVTSTAEGRDPR